MSEKEEEEDLFAEGELCYMPAEATDIWLTQPVDEEEWDDFMKTYPDYNASGWYVKVEVHKDDSEENKQEEEQKEK